MFGEKNNLKDVNQNSREIALKDTYVFLSYQKTSKLITALYMVTDIIEKDEPIRLKLRTLGGAVITDTFVSPSNALPKIAEIMSFLDIAGSVNIVSEMNANILRKEFFKLKKSIEDYTQGSAFTSAPQVMIADIFSDTFSLPSESFMSHENTTQDKPNTTRIGVQKGSTLLKALSSVDMSNRTPMGVKRTSHGIAEFEALKKDRKEQIISIIKVTGGGATITDIRLKATGSLASCSEKTLQRELIGMLKDGTLKKTGEKRWSRYFVS